jgi:UDP-3-O-[3-hydroxymyristoyl] glucosamine N-acyltransferase
VGVDAVIGAAARLGSHSRIGKGARVHSGAVVDRDIRIPERGVVLAASRVQSRLAA